MHAYPDSASRKIRVAPNESVGIKLEQPLVADTGRLVPQRPVAAPLVYSGQLGQGAGIQIEPRDRQANRLAGSDGDAPELQQIGRRREAEIEIEEVVDVRTRRTVERPRSFPARDDDIDGTVADSPPNVAGPGPPLVIALHDVGQPRRSVLMTVRRGAPHAPTRIVAFERARVVAGRIEPPPHHRRDDCHGRSSLREAPGISPGSRTCAQ